MEFYSKEMKKVKKVEKMKKKNLIKKKKKFAYAVLSI